MPDQAQPVLYQCGCVSGSGTLSTLCPIHGMSMVTGRDLRFTGAGASPAPPPAEQERPDA